MYDNKMIWIILVLVLLQIGVILIIRLHKAINTNIKEMYDNDLKDLKRQGVIK